MKLRASSDIAWAIFLMLIDITTIHSITLSARANNASGTVTPIALAVFFSLRALPYL
jgi:hypothetical protein